MMVILYIFAGIISYIILYYVVKEAVKNAIIETREGHEEDHDDGEDRIAQMNCPNCNRLIDIDYPKCPYCGHRFS